MVQPAPQGVLAGAATSSKACLQTSQHLLLLGKCFSPCSSSAPPGSPERTFPGSREDTARGGNPLHLQASPNLEAPTPWAGGPTPPAQADPRAPLGHCMILAIGRCWRPALDGHWLQLPLGQSKAGSGSAEGTAQCSWRDMRTPTQRHRGAGCAGSEPSRALAHGFWPAVSAHGKHSCFPILVQTRLVAPETVAIWC